MPGTTSLPLPRGGRRQKACFTAVLSIALASWAPLFVGLGSQRHTVLKRNTRAVAAAGFGAELRGPSAAELEERFQRERQEGLYSGVEEDWPQWDEKSGTHSRVPRVTRMSSDWRGGNTPWEVAEFLLAELGCGNMQDVEEEGREDGLTVTGRLTQLALAAGVGAVPLLGPMSWASSCIYKFSLDRDALEAEGHSALVSAPEVWQVNRSTSVFTNHLVTVGCGSRATISGADPVFHTIHRDWKEGLLDSCLLGCVGRKRVVLLAPDEMKTDVRMPWKPGEQCSRLQALRGLQDDGFWAALEALAERGDVTGGVFDLLPGNALFVPHGWWHAVRPLDTFTVITGLAKIPTAAAPVEPKPAVVGAV